MSFVDFNVFYIIISTAVSCLDIKDAIIFLQALLFMCTFSLFFACACVKRHLADSFDNRSQCRLI